MYMKTYAFEHLPFPKHARSHLPTRPHTRIIILVDIGRVNEFLYKRICIRDVLCQNLLILLLLSCKSMHNLGFIGAISRYIIVFM